MSRFLELFLTVLALVAVGAATYGARQQEMARAPVGTYELRVLDPIVTSGVKNGPATATEAR